MGLIVLHGTFLNISHVQLDVGIIWEYTLEYYQSRITLSWIWIMLCIHLPQKHDCIPRNCFKIQKHWDKFQSNIHGVHITDPHNTATLLQFVMTSDTHTYTMNQTQTYRYNVSNTNEQKARIPSRPIPRYSPSPNGRKRLWKRGDRKLERKIKKSLDFPLSVSSFGGGGEEHYISFTPHPCETIGVMRWVALA